MKYLPPVGSLPPVALPGPAGAPMTEQALLSARLPHPVPDTPNQAHRQRVRQKRPLACPRCSGRLRLRRSQRWQQWLVPQRLLSAFRCADARCGWNGLLSRRGVSAGASLRAALLPLLTPLLTTLLAPLPAAATACAAVAMVGATWLALHERPPLAVRVGARAHAPGSAFDGDPLPALHPLLKLTSTAPAVDPALAAAGASAAGPLALRRYCAWGKPGRMPYRGTVEQALRAAGLPAAVVAQIAADVASGRPAERLVIANDGIRSADGTRSFDARSFAMTYGHTLCLGTRVNFTAGHTEPARLYEAVDAGGRRHSVMIPEVCGNVSVIKAVRPGGGAPVISTTAGAPLQPLDRTLLTLWDPDILHADGPGDGSAHGVALPGSLALALAGLIALAATRRRG